MRWAKNRSDADAGRVSRDICDDFCLIIVDFTISWPLLFSRLSRHAFDGFHSQPSYSILMRGAIYRHDVRLMGLMLTMIWAYFAHASQQERGFRPLRVFAPCFDDYRLNDIYSFYKRRS